jgi:hypothetical protein
MIALLSRASMQVTRQIAVRWGERFPFYYVSEYPKSGATWLGRMLADYLQLPLPQRPRLPVATTAVIHNHWSYDPRLRRVAYVTRDGRDVMVSLYFHRVRILRDANHMSTGRVQDRYRRLFGASWDPDDVHGSLPRFIEDEFRRPLGSKEHWAAHVTAWGRAPADRVTQVRYEALLEDGPGELARLVTRLTGTEPDPVRVRATVEKFAFERVVGRARGTEDRSHFMRRGVAGDWRNHFTREAAEVFDRVAGDVLVELGYEPDRSWVGGVRPAGAVTG